MGSLISRFRGQKSTVEVLDNLVKDIDQLEQERQSSLQRQKRVIGFLILYSVLIYVGVVVLFYFYYLPNNWRDRLKYSIPLLIFPVVIWLLRKFLLWYYVRHLKTNDKALTDLKAKKKKILDDVMEKETYRKAKEILDKYDPTRSKPVEETPSKSAIPAVPQSEGQVLRQRSAVAMTPANQKSAPVPATPFATPARPQPVNGQNGAVQDTPFNRRPLPPVRPILPRDRSVLDRLVEAIVGDGPQNRYALICNTCHTHNGMALREEFDYVAFRCCYCLAFNPARKDKPHAPRLSRAESQVSRSGDEETTAAPAAAATAADATLLSDHTDAADTRRLSDAAPCAAVSTTDLPSSEQVDNSQDKTKS